MPCYHPLDAWRSSSGRDVNTGKWPITFKRDNAYLDMPVKVPCGQCIGCRLERSRQWAIRCVHEASLWPHNCWLTLTYDDDHLPLGGSLCKRDLQLFLKRLRKRFGSGIRFFACGEYGDLHSRPHYHVLLFNHDFVDKYFYKFSRMKKGGARYPLYRSDSLEALWPFGIALIGDVTFETAAYTARYILKKVNGDKAADHYSGRLPEYTVMSRRPGIAHGWFETWKGDVYPHDYVIIRNGIKCRPPRYYDKLHELEDCRAHNLVKIKRKYKGQLSALENTGEDLERKEKVKKIQIKRLYRSFEAINSKTNF